MSSDTKSHIEMCEREEKETRVGRRLAVSWSLIYGCDLQSIDRLYSDWREWEECGGATANKEIEKILGVLIQRGVNPTVFYEDRAKLREKMAKMIPRKYDPEAERLWFAAAKDWMELSYRVATDTQIHTHALFSASKIYERHDRLDDALRCLDEAVAHHSHSVKPFYSRANLFRQLKDYQHELQGIYRFQANIRVLYFHASAYVQIGMRLLGWKSLVVHTVSVGQHCVVLRGIRTHSMILKLPLV
jgi:hypothetical protein